MVGLMWIKKAERDGSEIGIETREMGTKEDPCMGGIITRELNDLDLAVIIDGEKMGRLAALLLAHKGVCLEGAWPPILPIIEGELCPTDKGLPRKNEQEHEAHAQSDDGG
jgi:hypothetical protein